MLTRMAVLTILDGHVDQDGHADHLRWPCEPFKVVMLTRMVMLTDGHFKMA